MQRFVIVGMPRSGTTLLAERLAAISGVYVSPETHLFRCLPASATGRRFSQAEALEIAARMAALSGIGVSSSDEGGTASQLFPLGLTATELLFEFVRRNSDSEGRDFHFCGEKTPLHLEYLQRMLEEDDQILAIAVVRDPRDVVRSLRLVGWDSKSNFRRGLRWSRYSKILRRALRYQPERVLAIQYEDLVSEEPEVMRTVASFLGLPARNRLYPLKTAPSTFDEAAEPWKAAALRETDSSAALRWRNSPNCGDWLTSIGAGREALVWGYQQNLIVRVLSGPVQFAIGAVIAAKRALRIWA